MPAPRTAADRRPPRAARRALATLFAVSLLGAVSVRWTTTSAAHQALPTEREEEQLARATCGGCHAFPPPEILPKQAWRDELVRMMFIREKRLPRIGPPATVNAGIQLPADMERVLPFYVRHAPEHLARPDAWPDPSSSPIRFDRAGLTMSDMPETPAVSNVQLIDLDADGQLDLLGSDMRQGVVFTGHPADAAGSLSTIASIPHPAHVTVADVDRDGVRDLLVADLGEFLPGDHDKGAVIWLRGLGKGKFGALWVDGWPRVADVEPGDFNGDGKTDLVVAAFGWRQTGQVAILDSAALTRAAAPASRHTIDPRAGSIHVIPADLNKDGKMDFVTVLAQEHETVLAYLNKGTGDFAFDQKVIYAAPHPNWGSSGIQLVDLDKDGDLDVLLTHGDTFDDGIVKPYHGIQWLENRGSYPFVEHTLAQMPGVHRAVAADLDGDGDLDVVACALLARGSDVDESTLPALVWLEQTTPGTFVRHTLERGSPRHATLDVGDIDNDGDLDIVVGNFSIDKPIKSWVEVWTNQRAVKAGASSK